MRVIIARSRTLARGRDGVLAAIDDLVSTLDGCVAEIISGAAVGVDGIGEAWARSRKPPISVRRMPADWAQHGRSAGPIRNRATTEHAGALALVWDGVSRGCADMRAAATKEGLVVRERVLVGRSAG